MKNLTAYIFVGIVSAVLVISGLFIAMVSADNTVVVSPSDMATSFAEVSADSSK